MTSRKKLIEVSLPLEAINAESAREKSIRHGHPSTLHLWWARRPLAAARAVIWSSLVDDPSSLPEQFPTEEEQAKERQRLFSILERLVKWENSNNQDVLAEAKAEIMKSTGGNPPALLDPFAGGGSIPLEAQRLGLEAHAGDLNPVAVMINKAMIEIPPKFGGQPPVNPESRCLMNDQWAGTSGLAEDVRYYGEWMKKEAFKRIGHLYPKVKDEHGQEHTVIAWIWARTVKCPNPACGCEMTLASSFELSKKKGREAYIQPIISRERKSAAPSPAERRYAGVSLAEGKSAAPSPAERRYAGVSPAEGKSAAPSPAERRYTGVSPAEGKSAAPSPAERRYAGVSPTEGKSAAPSPAERRYAGVSPAERKSAAPSPAERRYTGVSPAERRYAGVSPAEGKSAAPSPAERRYAGVSPAEGKSADLSSAKYHSRGYLPHIEMPGLIQHITFRLFDSLPADVIKRLKDELADIPESEKKAALIERVNKYAAAGYGSSYLKNPDVAEIVQNALLHFDNKRYKLLEWCIMPNHVHVLIKMLEGHTLSEILHSWKSFTSKKANEILKRQGQFWHPEYFDRYIRDENNYNAAVAYIRNNPVKAGLVSRAEEWRWGSAWENSRRDTRRPQDAPGEPQVRYEVKYGKNAPEAPKTGRGQFKCICCGTPVTGDYIKTEGQAKRIGAQLMAIVAEGKNGRIYIAPNDEHIQAAQVDKPTDYPTGQMPKNPRWFSPPDYGLPNYEDLFTNRQLTALTTFSDLVAEARAQVEKDGGSQEYANAVGVYLAFVVDKISMNHNALCSWHNGRETIQTVFARQAIPMVWDYAEANPFSNSTGCWDNMLEWVTKTVTNLPEGKPGTVNQHVAQADNGLREIIVSTDPPYYDNIGYADLSDFFYIWLRQNSKNIYPDLLRTMLVPKAEELVATPYRFEGGKIEARKFFEDGMRETFKQIYTYSLEDIPVTVYYAYKQSEDDGNNTSSTGWETMLSAIIEAGFSVTGTWPMRTEMESRSLGRVGTNALASSIVLVCRKRLADAPTTTRRNFINALKRELKPALQKLQASNIAPVDLAQSAIGPGMGVYSRFSKVLEADGTPMSIRSALQIINQELDLYFTEQDDELDRDSRFCVDLYTQYAFNDMKFGTADVLARAKNTSVEKLRAAGVLYAEKGVVRLLTREEMRSAQEKRYAGIPPAMRTIPSAKAPHIIWQLTQQLTRAIDKDGVVGAAQIIADISTSEPEQAKALAYRLFQIAERKGWTGEAYAYNSLVIAWPEVQSKAADITAQLKSTKQLSMFDKEGK